MMAACGFAHTLVVTQDGALWACGRGFYGQLGLNIREDRLSFERVGARACGAEGRGGVKHPPAQTKKSNSLPHTRSRPWRRRLASITRRR